METRVVCCVGCVRDPPFCSDPSLWWWHTFPRGFHIQHLPCLPTPKARDLLDWLLSIKAIHTHLLSGLEVITQAWTGYHDPGRALVCIRLSYNIVKEKMEILTLSPKDLQRRKFIHPYSSDQWKRPFIEMPDENMRTFIFTRHSSVRLLCHVTAECGDRRRGRSLGCLWAACCLAGP